MTIRAKDFFLYDPKLQKEIRNNNHENRATGDTVPALISESSVHL